MAVLPTIYYEYSRYEAATMLEAAISIADKKKCLWAAEIFNQD